jgi:hypothetical protein
MKQSDPQMVETIPRRTKLSLFPQVAIAVLSGAAAMYCIQNISAPRPAGGAAPAAPRPQPAPAQAPVPVSPDASLNLPHMPDLNAPPPPQSMMVLPEPDGSAKETPAASAPEAEGRSASGAEAAGETAPPRPGPEFVPVAGIGMQFNRVQFHKPAWKRQSPAAARPRPAPSAATASPGRPASPDTRQIESVPVLFAKPPLPDIAPPNILPSPPEPVFWTDERCLKVIASGLIALIGAYYVFFTSGLFSALSGREDSPPA